MRVLTVGGGGCTQGFVVWIVLRMLGVKVKLLGSKVEPPNGRWTYGPPTIGLDIICDGHCGRRGSL